MSAVMLGVATALQMLAGLFCFALAVLLASDVLRRWRRERRLAQARAAARTREQRRAETVAAAIQRDARRCELCAAARPVLELVEFTDDASWMCHQCARLFDGARPHSARWTA